jgi:thiol-disulfide isomerase/thioredoxin
MHAALETLYVTAPRCHFCEGGRAVLAELAERFPLEVREVDLASEEGRAVAARWRVPYPPILLVDGRLVGFGRLSLRRLARDLEAVAEARRVVHP